MTAEQIRLHEAVRNHAPDVNRQPGHWLLASLGKKVLRPGGLELTRRLLGRLAPGASDRVVEFAPGLGETARQTLAAQPWSYVGVDRERAIAEKLQSQLGSPSARFIHASAEATGLPPGCATLVYGEAMLSMQTPEQKKRIIAEAYRLLEPGGRYGIHELALLPDDVDAGVRRELEREMSLNIHVGVRPATLREWKELLVGCGFEVAWQSTAPMHLLEPRRVLADEGVAGVLRILSNVARKPAARRRVFSMRRLFRTYRDHLVAVAMVCVKRPAAA
jgi:SAM-dependent methyltransferase